MVNRSTPEADAAPSSRKRAALLLASMSALSVWFLPLDLPTRAHHLAAIFAAVIVLWVSEALPIAVTALLIAPLMIITGVTDAKSAFAPYADPLLFLFVGGFFIARAMTRHGLDRRIAGALVSLPGVAGVPSRVRAAFMLAGLALSMWISNTASTAILLPILLGTMGVSLDPPKSAPTGPEARAVSGNLMAVAYGASLGGLGTLVGSPPNLIAARFIREAGVDFGFVEWLGVGLPTSLVLLLLLYLVMARSHPASGLTQAGELTRDRSKLTRGEQVTALSFALAVTGWMVPGIAKAAGASWGAPLAHALPGGAVALLATIPLFAFRAPSTSGGEPERVLPWRDAARIDWGIIMLFGGGISLGTQMLDTGLAERIAHAIVSVTGVEGVWSLTALMTVFTIFFTEVCSNTASANMLVPLALAAASDLDVSPLPPALGVGLAASCAFMLPIATGPNAIAYGTGRIPLRSMLRTGLLLNLISAAAILLMLRLLSGIYGWTS
ncbi:MAG: SLC13/DASS family transporter [Deltaproteobacteria bacterium]|nr:SLC13/DASS family transporter [Deltaproteobacteria bacterium]